MKRVVTAFAAIGLVAAAATACSSGESGDGSGGKTYTMRFTAAIDTSFTYGESMSRMADQIAKNSNGRIKVHKFYNTDLGSQQAQVQGTVSGATQVNFTSPAWLTSYVPDLQALYLPFLYKSADEVYKMEDGPIGQQVNDMILEKTGMRVLGWSQVGFKNIVNSAHPINTLADFKGLKIRSISSPINIATIKAFGATPVQLGFSEIPTSLQTGVIQGFDSSDSIFLASKFWESAKYDAEVGFYWEYIPELINDKFYQSLPDDLQKVVTQAAADSQEWCRTAEQSSEAAAQKELESHGVKISHPTADALAEMRAAMSPVYDTAKSNVGADGKELITKLLSQSS